MIRLHQLAAILTACAAFCAAPRVSAAPPWWEGSPEDVPAAAAQTGKPVVLYFTSPNAAECIRMDEETWRPMNPVWADLQFIWLKLEPQRDAEFFKYWQINQVPQVVILDSQMKDQLRLRGFMTIDQLKEALPRVERGLPTKLTTTNGRVVPASNPLFGFDQNDRDPFKGHLYLEKFDSYKLIGSIRNPPFYPVVQAASRIDSVNGLDKTPCLVVDAGPNGMATIRIEVSPTFESIDQVLGRIRVRTSLKAMTPLGKIPVDVMALSVVRTDILDPEKAEQLYFASLSDADKGVWRQKEIVSGPVNFRLNKAFIILSAQNPGMSFLVDNIEADLIPADDAIPYLELDSQVKTIAAVPEDSGAGKGVNPDDFFTKLSTRTEVAAPTAVSNTQTGAAPGAPGKPGRTPDDVIASLANEFASLGPEQRAGFFKSRGVSDKDRLRVVYLLRLQGIQLTAPSEFSKPE